MHCGEVMMSHLKQVLLETYGSFADKRIKKIETGKSFIADDRGPGDYGADKDLLSYFCMVFVTVLNEELVKIGLYRNVPVSEDVKQWVSNVGGSLNPGTSMNGSLEFEVKRGQQERLLELAQSLDAIVLPGAPRYTVPSYKYVCPRTGDALRRLNSALDRAWSEQKS
jgi:hypothetical protein